ncbi:carboxypeptidase regulatory-like domain-containing protein [Herbiconiux moechotypicola]|uniref:alpha-amylase n=1 Tax=Herbiconiux moechotypicola TaxID=637393 RepID=A0ABN3D7L0_9MICO|nr:carboxypeptidase regulatory-like domain-containing protein [Herbiconiux moechotypicola]MCS5728492.1 carboxypeptidase regulatory-like domain-containing protein [Herbiconiux moechotypicola]
MRRSPAVIAAIAGVVVALLFGSGVPAVAVPAVGAPTPSVTAAAAKGTATVSGTVRQTTPNGLAAVDTPSVKAFDARGVEVGGVDGEGDGSFVLSGLPAGPVTLFFQASEDFGLLSQWWSGRSSRETADVIPLAAGSTRSGLDVVLQPKASVSGVVRGAPAARAGSTPGAPGPLAGISVSLTVAGRVTAQTSTDSTGRYGFAGLYEGEYGVGFESPEGLYFAAGLTDAVELSTGEQRTGADVVLERAAQLAGVVTGGSPARAAAEVSVRVVDLAGEQAGDAVTDSRGRYTVGGLRAGEYRVVYGESWDEAPAFVALTSPVTVAGASVTTRDVRLVKTGSVSGRVRSQDGAPAESVTVRAYDSAGVASERYTTTDETGSYTLAGLVPGSYRLSFSGSGYLPQWFKGAASLDTATPVTVGEGSALTGKDVTLSRGASVSGTVRRADTEPGGPVTSEVELWREGEASAAYAVLTHGEGQYTLAGVTPGTYRVRFPVWDAGHVEQWWRGSADRAGATKLVLGASTVVTGVDAVLPVRAAVTGVVRSAPVAGRAAAPLAGARVSVYDDTDSLVTWATTGSDGRYSVSPLAPGDYRFGFSHPAHVARYSGGGPSLAGAASVSIGSSTGSIAGPDAVLSPAASVSGTVKAGSKALAEVGVTVIDARGDEVAWASTDARGHYTVGGLAAGSYKVHFSLERDSWQVSRGYLTQWWPRAEREQTGGVITLGAGEKRAGIDAAAVVGGVVSGVVRSPTGEATRLASVSIALSGDGRAQIDRVFTDETGVYHLTGLAPGVYDVSVTTDNGLMEVERRGLALTAGQTMKGVSFTIPSRATGSVSGEVVSWGASHKPLAAEVSLYDEAGVLRGATTAWNGAYRLDFVEPGVYTLRFTAEGAYAPQWYGGKPDLARANRITVRENQVSTAKTVVMRAGARIQGTVRGAGAGLAGVPVAAWDSAGALVAQTKTDARGAYSLDRLASGTYRVGANVAGTGGMFVASLPDWAPVYSGGAGSLAGASRIGLTSAGTVTGRDLTLPTAAHLSGTVKTATAPGFHQARVEVLSASGAVVATQTVGSRGAYAFDSLRAGTYRVRATVLDPGTGRAPGTSGPVSVRAGQRATGKNVVVATGGAISGRITDPEGAPLSGIWVLVWRGGTDGNASAPVTRTRTGLDGSYHVLGLEAGEYSLGFTDTPTDDGTLLGGTAYRDEFYPNRYSLSTAIPISVASGAAVKGRNVVLTRLLPVASTPSVSGTPRPGTVLSATAGRWAPEPVALTYRWARDGVAIPGATKPSYRVVSADVGADLTVTVTGTASGYGPTPRTSDAVHVTR